MSKERIAGVALDAEIAERVFGIVPRLIRVRGEVDTPLVPVYDSWTIDGRSSRSELIELHGPRAYSTDIAAAFQVVEAMKVKGWQKYELRIDGDQHIACFWQDFHRDERVTRIADSLPLAICLASLAAIEAAASRNAQLETPLSSPLPDTPRE